MAQGIAYQKRLQGLSSLIGNTPLLEIKLRYKGKIQKVYAKAEYMNMTGSIKDRMAYHIMENAYARSMPKEGTPINCVEKNFKGDPAIRLPYCARRV